jgi:TonB family protein
MLFVVGFPAVTTTHYPYPLHVMLIAPPIEPPRPARSMARFKQVPPPRRLFRPLPSPPLEAVSHPNLPAPPVLPAARVPVPPVTASLELPRPLPRPAAPAPQVKTGSFASIGSSASAAKPRAAPDVSPRMSLKASGFAAVQTAAAPSALRKGTLSASGAFDAAVAGTVPHRGGLSAPGEFGQAVAGDFSLHQATVSRTGGFSQVSVASTVPGRSATRNAGFGDAAVAFPEAPLLRRVAAASLTEPIEILDKPRPDYTPEARRLGIQGEVMLEVLFEATGRVRVVRLLSGLGHGLDENAMAAATRIHFRPARKDGVPVDSSAVVHIVFQLAY